MIAYLNALLFLAARQSMVDWGANRSTVSSRWNKGETILNFDFAISG